MYVCMHARVPVLVAPHGSEPQAIDAATKASRRSVVEHRVKGSRALPPRELSVGGILWRISERQAVHIPWCQLIRFSSRLDSRLRTPQARSVKLCPMPAFRKINLYWSHCYHCLRLSTTIHSIYAISLSSLYWLVCTHAVRQAGKADAEADRAARPCHTTNTTSG